MRPLMTKYEYAITCALKYKVKGFESMYRAYMDYIDGLTVEQAGSWV